VRRAHLLLGGCLLVVGVPVHDPADAAGESRRGVEGEVVLADQRLPEPAVRLRAQPPELEPVPMPRVRPRKPGPVPMPLVQRREPGPVRMPQVRPFTPDDSDPFPFSRGR
jgi:hypothetical protein